MIRAPLAALVVLSPFACSDDPPQPKPVDGVEPGFYQDSIEVLQRLEGSSFVEITEVRASADGTVFFCSGVQGLNIVDASVPDRMKSVAKLVPSEGDPRFPRCQHLAYTDELVYLANKGDELQPTPFVTVFDRTQSPPREVSTYLSTGPSFEGLAAVDDYLLVAQHGQGLAVLQLQGQSLILRAELPGFTNAWAVSIAGDTAYVADGIGGLVVVDIAQRQTPSIVGRIGLPGASQSVEIDPDSMVAYVAAGQGGLHAVDVADPTAPALLGTAATPGTALQVAIDGTHAVVADWNDIRVFDTSDPADMGLVATETIDTGNGLSRVLGVGAHDGFIFGGEWTGLYSMELHAGLDGPDIWLRDRVVEMGAVPSGTRRANVVVLRNEGNEPLVLWEISAPGKQFSLSDEQLIIEAGELASFEVIYDSNKDSQESEWITLRSDDPDQSAVQLQVVANRPGVSVGDEAPEVAMQLLDGGEWRLSEQRGKVVLLAYFATF